MISNDLNVKNNSGEVEYKKVDIGIALLPLSPLFMLIAIYIRWKKSVFTGIKSVICQ